MTQAASSASVVKGLLVAAAQGRLHEVQSLLDGGRCRVNDEDEVCTSRGSTLVYQSEVCCVFAVKPVCSRVECCLFAVFVCLYVCVYQVRVGVFLDRRIFITPTYVYMYIHISRYHGKHGISLWVIRYIPTV